MKTLNQCALLLLLMMGTACKSKLGTATESEKAASTAFQDPPRWADRVVWYQIFVERFRNGDSANDPTAADIAGSYPGFVPENWQVTPWGQDWYKEDDYFAALEGKHDFGGNKISSIDQKLQSRRYGGDLQGVLDQIDYLDSLGITAIYFNPLNDAPSLHKYDARNWRHIDRNFGPDPRRDVLTMASETPEDPASWQFTEADKLFLKVIEEFHKRNIKVILDYSWNHTGHTFWAWQDVVEKQRASPFADWYTIRKFDDPATAESEFAYSGWAGVHELPEIRKTTQYDHSKGIRAYEGNLHSEAAKAHIFHVSKRWLDPDGDGNPADGVDGFRLDVAAEVPLDFWREYRSFVRGINPEAYLLGEIWWERWPEKLLNPEPFLRGDVFDATMNYRWYRAARHFFNAAPDKLPASAFVDSLNAYRAHVSKESNYAMMNLTASHDVPRTLTSLYNKNRYKHQTKPEQNPAYKIHKPDAATYETLKLLLVQQFTYIGAPHIWAGDEMGMWGADDPGNRKPLIWPDYQFEPETTHPLGSNRPKDEVKFNEALFNFYRKLIRIRKEHAALVEGEIDFIKIDDEGEVLAYSRFRGAEEVIAVFNASQESRTITLPLKTAKVYRDVLGGTALRRKNRELTLILPARTAAILAGGAKALKQL